MNEAKHLTAAQVTKIQDNVGEAVAKVIEDMKLRQWAVERTTNVAEAEAVYDFVTKPAAEIKVTIE